MSETLTVESVPAEAIHVNIAYLCNVVIRDVNEYSNVRIFAFHTNIRMRFLDSNIRIIF